MNSHTHDDASGHRSGEPAMARHSSITFDWRIVKIDETYQCDAARLARVGVKSVATYYVYDANRHVHCCELTPSYELHAVYTDAEFTDFDATTESVRDEVDEALREAMGEQDVVYMHVGGLDKRAQRPAVSPPDREDDESSEAFYSRAVEALYEYYQGNCPCF